MCTAIYLQVALLAIAANRLNLHVNAVFRALRILIVLARQVINSFVIKNKTQSMYLHNLHCRYYNN